MNHSSISRAFALALLSATTFTLAGCATSKMKSSPQPASTSSTPTKEYEFHDMSTGRFFGGPLQKNAQAQQTQQDQPTSKQ